MKNNFLSTSVLSNYSNYVKSGNGATYPLLGVGNISLSEPPAGLVTRNCPTDVDVSTPGVVQRWDNTACGLLEIQESKVSCLKSLHTVVKRKLAELDSLVRTSMSILVQKSASHVSTSSQLRHIRQASIMKIANWKIATVNATNNLYVSKPERTEWSCSTTRTRPQRYGKQATGYGIHEARIDMDGEHIIG
ncbi:hypothetical protein CL622_07605 [archaeon]|nr:hypothetical protein [archaeon]|tara:strand:+ start:6537 stop:7109 length:573 start_codon:yes stop_codon:yes gene_type:complete